MEHLQGVMTFLGEVKMRKSITAEMYVVRFYMYRNFTEDYYSLQNCKICFALKKIPRSEERTYYIADFRIN